MTENKELTEFSRKRDYEEKITEKLVETSDVLRAVSGDPTYKNLRYAYDTVRAFFDLNMFSTFYLKKCEDLIIPKLKDMETLLFGDLDDPLTFSLFTRYNVFIEIDRGAIKVYNPQNILGELRQIFFMLKQYGYAQGLYLQKPYDRKFGNEAISDVMEM